MSVTLDMIWAVKGAQMSNSNSGGKWVALKGKRKEERNESAVELGESVLAV